MSTIEALEKNKLNTLHAAYRSIEPARYHESWTDFLPAQPGTVLDIGAASGRDAEWFASKGWKVTAVEPNPQWHRLAKPCEDIEWIEDSLPNLIRLFHKPQFDVVLVSNVWPMLSRFEQQQSLIRLFGLVDDLGVLIVTWSTADVQENHIDQLSLQRALIIESEDHLNPGEQLMSAVFSKALYEGPEQR